MEPKGVKVWVSVQVKGKVVQLNLGTFTLEQIYNLLAPEIAERDSHISSVMRLAFGYTGEVEQLLRNVAKLAGRPFDGVRWEWIAHRLEEVSCV